MKKYQSAILLSISAMLIANSIGAAQHNVQYDKVMPDKAEDLITFTSNYVNREPVKYYLFYGNRSYLDIQTIDSKGINETIIINMRFLSEIRNDINITYMIYGWYNENPNGPSLYPLWPIQFDYVISYSNGVSNYGRYLDMHGTRINTDITNTTLINGANITFNLPKSFFINATCFEYIGESYEYLGEMKWVMDSTLPIEEYAEHPIDWVQAYLVIGIISGASITTVAVAYYWHRKEKGVK